MNELTVIKPSYRRRQKRRDKRLSEELIECYRKGGKSGEKAKGYTRKRVGLNFEFSSTCEGMKVRSGGTKIQTDNLQPLIRFLQRNTGRHWDKVYSELCERMDKNSMLGLHVYQHLCHFVELNVYYKERKLMVLGRFGGERELTAGWWPAFYVHPRSGVLCQVKKKKKWQRQN